MKASTKTYVSNRENLSSIVSDYIKEAILTGIYKEGGDRILETEVAFN